MPNFTKLKLVFMGTPDFSAAILERILAWPNGEVIAAYTQPDRPAGRGKRLQASPVKEMALRYGLEVRQPLNFKEPDEIAGLAELKPDFLLVAAYGLILPQTVLDIPRFAPLNIHASLLPKYRGAAPIQRAVMNGDAETGIALMHMEAGLDTGPVYALRSITIGPDDTSGQVHDALAHLGGELLLETLPGIAAGEIGAMPQNDAAAAYAPKLSKEDGRIDFRKTVCEVHNQMRGVTPWPGAWCELQRGGEGVIIRTRIYPGRSAPSEADTEPGTVLGGIGDNLAIQCADGVYLIPWLCPAGSKMMAAPDFIRGYLHQAEVCKVVFNNGQ